MAAIQNPNPQLADQFEQDWKQAQSRYQAGLDAGLDEKDAAQTYLMPVQQKWQIVQSSPTLQTDPQKLNQFNKEFETANDTFLKNYSDYSSDGGQAAAQGTILPTLQKWSIEGALPEKRPLIPHTPEQINSWFQNNPAMQSEETDALSQIQSGTPETQAILANPMLLKAPTFAPRWTARFLDAVQQEKEAAIPPSPVALARERNVFSDAEGKLYDAHNNLIPGNEGLKSYYDEQLAKLDAQATNSVPAAASPPVAPAPDINQYNPAPDRFSIQPSPADSGLPDVNALSTPKSQQDFDALPRGALYVNPADGRTYRKK
jgi:hypothetical protein